MKSLYTLVGIKHRNALEFVAALPADEPMTMIREPDNKFDQNAVQVWARGRHVGFVKATEARALALKMDASGKSYVGKLVKAEHWPMIEVEE